MYFLTPLLTTPVGWVWVEKLTGPHRRARHGLSSLSYFVGRNFCQISLNIRRLVTLLNWAQHFSSSLHLHCTTEFLLIFFVIFLLLLTFFKLIFFCFEIIHYADINAVRILHIFQWKCIFFSFVICFNWFAIFVAFCWILFHFF